MNFSNLEYQVDFDYLKDIEYYKDYNHKKRVWHEENFSYYLRFLHLGLWEDYVLSNKIHSPFFQWFELIYAPKHKINYPFKNDSITPIFEKKYKDIISNKEIIANFPPKGEIIINDMFIATPLVQAPNQLTTEKGLQKIIYQNNYANETLSSITEHLVKIEEKIFKDKNVNKHDMASTSNLSFVPCQIDGNFNLGNTDLINELEKRLSKLHISNTNNINTLTNEESENSDINSETNFETLAQQFDTNDDINQLTNDFSKLNKIHQSKQSTFGKNPKPTIRNYWNRPSLPDVQLEERTFQFDRSQYDGNSVYEWNIDGHSEHQIMNIVQEMTMAANAYKAHNNTQLQIVNIITSGFTGSLKGWWDFYISQEEKDYILSAKKTIIKQENNQQIQTFEDDMVNTLIFAIIKNFVGDPTTFQEKTSEILMNLHCRKLTDFRWYKDNYLVKVFSRPDCKESYWKERFIAGLPKLFAERVRQKLRENFNNTIPYQNLTYGDLINYINKEGLAVCADLRFKEKLKKDRINSKNELGNFCQQYGYQPLNGPSTSKSKVFKKRSSKYFRKKKYNLPENYKKGKDYASKSKKPYRLNYKKSKRKSKDIIICHKCGRNGHTANNCYAKTKINELNVSEDLKEQIRKIILNTDSDSDESISDFQTNDLNILENTTSSSEDSDICECIGKCHCNNLINVITSSSINVLSQDDKDLLNSLDSIKDKNIQELLIKQMLNKTNNITPANNENFNLKNIYERFTEAKPISMQELQEELKIVKQEIKEIKNKIFILEKEKPSTFKNKNIEINNEEENKIENVTIGKLINNQVSQKWNTQITLVKDNFKINLTALIDSGADMNCIQEGIFPTQFYEKTTSRLTGAGGTKLIVNYKVSDVHICNDQDYCYKTHLILVKDLSSPLILGTPFITKLYPFMVHDDGIRTNVFGKEIIFKFCEPPLYSTINVLNYKTQQAKYLINEINNVRITNQLNDNNIQNKITGLKLKFEKKCLF